VKKQNLDQYTIIVFLTDNGNEQLRYNGGFRGLKGSVLEGGNRVPLLISGAGMPGQGKDIGAFTAHVDVLPTLLDVLKIRLPKEIRSDGYSFYPQLKGDAERKDRLFYNTWNRGWPEPYRNTALYHGNHKLVAINAEEGRPESFALYDLTKDPFEQNNLAVQLSRITDQLKTEMDSLYSDILSSPNLSPRRLVVGSVHENPVMLSRSDWSSVSLYNWRAENVTGYWTIRVSEDGKYSFRPIAMKPIEKDTRVVVRLGKIQRSITVAGGERWVEIKDIFLTKGNYNLEAWFETPSNVTGPFYLEVTKK
jgi:arylsulfatase